MFLKFFLNQKNNLTKFFLIKIKKISLNFFQMLLSFGLLWWFLLIFLDYVKKDSSVPTSEKIKNVRKVMDLLVNPDQVDAVQKEELARMQRMLEETLTKNMHLQKDLEHLSQEVVRLSKLVVPAISSN